jgi:hypothetical protein
MDLNQNLLHGITAPLNVHRRHTTPCIISILASTARQWGNNLDNLDMKSTTTIMLPDQDKLTNLDGYTRLVNGFLG